MTVPIELSPLGTARAAILATDATIGADRQEAAMLAWLGQVREPLETEYNLEGEIPAIAWELACWQPGLSPTERQALLLLILLGLVQVRQGSTRIALRGQKGGELRLDFARRVLGKVQPVDDLPKLDPSAAATLMQELIDSGKVGTLVGTPGDFKPLVVAGNHLYLQKMLHLENQFAAALGRRLDSVVSGWSDRAVEEALNDVLARPPETRGQRVGLNNEQCAAVGASMRSPITIISGGPGTGKTTIVVSILRVLLRLGVAPGEIALAAPTGKAANRMLGAIEEGSQGIANPTEADRVVAAWPEPCKPRTMHRLLGYSHSNGRFNHHQNNRLAEKIVIVDEASMIDLALMERLVRSLPDDGRLILLGDARQLPSVEAGAVLRDLCKVHADDPHCGFAVVILQESHRVRKDPHGLNLLRVAHKIDQGEAPRFDCERSGDDVVVERGSVDALKFEGVEFVASPPGSPVLDEFLEQWAKEGGQAPPGLDKLIDRAYVLSENGFSGDDQQKLSAIFAYSGSFRILCLTRVLPTGSDRINESLHRRALDRLDWHPGDDQFLAGEPVMMQVNDYQRMIFNGDQGVILNVADRGRARAAPMAVFRRSNGFAAFHLESLRSSLALSYAITVHKAQGSEFDRVALVLPDRDLPINTREILYTALTRARKSAVIVGDREILELGIKKTIERDSGIVEKLRT